MRPQPLALCAVLLLLVADAAAQSDDYPATGQGAMSSVQVTGRARTHHVPHQDLEAVSGMGGSLSAANASPRGARFTLLLPLVAPST